MYTYIYILCNDNGWLFWLLQWTFPQHKKERLSSGHASARSPRLSQQLQTASGKNVRKRYWNASHVHSLTAINSWMNWLENCALWIWASFLGLFCLRAAQEKRWFVLCPRLPLTNRPLDAAARCVLRTCFNSSLLVPGSVKKQPLYLQIVNIIEIDKYLNETIEIDWNRLK